MHTHSHITSNILQIKMCKIQINFEFLLSDLSLPNFYVFFFVKFFHNSPKITILNSIYLLINRNLFYRLSSKDLYFYLVLDSIVSFHQNKIPKKPKTQKPNTTNDLLIMLYFIIYIILLIKS